MSPGASWRPPYMEPDLSGSDLYYVCLVAAPSAQDSKLVWEEGPASLRWLARWRLAGRQGPHQSPHRHQRGRHAQPSHEARKLFAVGPIHPPIGTHFFPIPWALQLHVRPVPRLRPPL